MALGGGTWTTQNKVLPGTYINFKSAKNTDFELAERGIVTMPVEGLGWGPSGVFKVTVKDFYEDTFKIFGRDYDDDKLKGLRDLFKHAKVAYLYRLDAGGTKATCALMTAKYEGTRGNDISFFCKQNIDDDSMFDVFTKIDGKTVDKQTVSKSEDLVDNDYVTFKAGVELVDNTGAQCSGGTDKTVTGEEHSAYLKAIESYSYNVMGVVTEDDTVKKMYSSFVRRMRDEIGVKFQLVLYNHPADYFGVINVNNKTLDSDHSPASLVYWVSGAQASCKVNSTLLNTLYDGEFTVNTAYTQNELADAIANGKFVLHNVGDEVRVLDDINSKVTVTEEENELFKDNQTVRVIDQLANEDAILFNTKYIGKIKNNEAGRTALWSDLAKIRKKLQEMEAIEDFNDKDVTVEKGNDNKSVVVNNVITITGTMSKLYITTVIQ